MAAIDGPAGPPMATKSAMDRPAGPVMAGDHLRHDSTLMMLVRVGYCLIFVYGGIGFLSLVHFRSFSKCQKGMACDEATLFGVSLFSFLPIYWSI